MADLASKRSLEKLRLDGGLLCLDFVNTVHDRSESPLYDYLTDYNALLAWLAKCKAAPEAVLNQLSKSSRSGKSASARYVKQARDLRENLYRIFSALAHDRNPSQKDLDSLDAWMRQTWKALRLEQGPDQWQWSWIARHIDLGHPLRLVVKSAVDLLLSHEVNRIRECPACGWVFLDRSKNGSRRWCSMDTCGSIDKVTRYYYRKKKQSRS